MLNRTHPLLPHSCSQSLWFFQANSHASPHPLLQLGTPGARAHWQLQSLCLNQVSILPKCCKSSSLLPIFVHCFLLYKRCPTVYTVKESNTVPIGIIIMVTPIIIRTPLRSCILYPIKELKAEVILLFGRPEAWTCIPQAQDHFPFQCGLCWPEADTHARAAQWFHYQSQVVWNSFPLASITA